MSNYTQSIGFTNSCARCREASVVAGMTIACRMHGGQSSEINEETVARLAKFGKEKKLYTQSEVDRLIREARIDEIRRGKINGYYSSPLIHKANRRLESLSKQEEGSKG